MGLGGMPPKKDDKGGKKKESSSAGGKAKKKKWSKGKQKEKLNAAVFFDKNLYEKLKKEVPNYKLITPSIISERMRRNDESAMCDTNGCFPGQSRGYKSPNR